MGERAPVVVQHNVAMRRPWPDLGRVGEATSVPTPAVGLRDRWGATASPEIGGERSRYFGGATSSGVDERTARVRMHVRAELAVRSSYLSKS